MRFWEKVNRWVFGVPAASTVNFDSDPMPIDTMIRLMFGQTNPPRVTRAEALGVPAVLRGRNMICSVATLPLVQLAPDLRVVRHPLFEQINPNVANVVTLAQTLEDLLFDGVSWWRVTERDATNFPSHAEHLDIEQVSLNPPLGATPTPHLPSGHPTHGVIWVDGEEVSLRSIIQFDSPNPGLLAFAGRPVQRAIALDRMAKTYADDPSPKDYFTPAGDADPADDDAIRQMLADWLAARQKGATAYVPAALRYNSVDSPSPRELQIVELQQRASLDIANGLGLDPEDLGISTTSRTYQNATDRRQDRINDTLAPYMRAITDRLSMGDVTRRGYRATFDLDDYMRADPLTRWTVYEKASGLGAITVEEIRTEERWPELPGTTAEVVPLRPVPNMAASRSSAVNFDDADRVHFADVPVTGFSVDREARIIEGLALPYGKIGTKFGRRFRFAQGALQWSDPTRVKLNSFHDTRETVGYAESLTETGDGLRVRFKVGRGPKGDQALQDADDKILDGMSVGVEFDFAADTVPDPTNRGVTLVRRATLRHVALTPEPSFDDARVFRVAASRTQGDTVDDDTVTEPQAPDAPADRPVETPAEPVTFSADQLAHLLQLGLPRVMSPGARVTLDAQPQDPGPQVVVPPRPRALTQVTDPAPYRFDRKGNIQRGSHDFCTDIVSGLRDKDEAAYDRVLGFLQVQFDVATGDVNELNPAIQRPDMYVGQLTYRTPIWNAINKGAPPNGVQPFTFPKFSSSSGLVGDHTETQEPSSGTFVTTSQTVTPAPLSGKMKITRETWDMGGNPAVSNLIWQEILRDWAEDLESKGATLLDTTACTGTGTVITAGAVDDNLDTAITNILSGLQFERGGFRYTDFMIHKALYQALSDARDTTGRKLFPAIGPTNADGTAAPRWASLNINGLTGTPAWALTNSTTNYASSYMFDRADVHGWATGPQRLTIDNIEVAHVYIGAWGYAATAASRTCAPLEVMYDPTA